MVDMPQTDTQHSETESAVPILTITPNAAVKVRELINEGALEGHALRVFVQGGGCSGLSYGMGFEENVYPQDRVVEVDDIRLVIDAVSLQYMHGAEVDYVDSLMGAGFAINNPNAIAACGCGKSFSTEDEETANTPGACNGCD